MRATPFPFDPELERQPAEVPVGAGGPIPAEGAAIYEVGPDGVTPVKWLLIPSEAAGTEYFPAVHCAAVGIVVVHSGQVTLVPADLTVGDQVVLTPGRWVLS